jgi:Flp pilus assembly pilin Flp
MKIAERLSAPVRSFFAETEGAALIEYGLLVLLLAALCIVLLQSIGSKVSIGFNSANAAIPLVSTGIETTRSNSFNATRVTP